MNAAMRQYLESVADDIETHPANVHRAVGDGMREYRRRLFRIYGIAAAAVVLLAAAAWTVSAGAEPPPPPDVSAIEVTASPATIESDETSQLTATGTFSDGSTQDLTATAVWTTSDPRIAAINGGGVVTAKSAGTATITASQDGVVGTTTVTVPPPDVVLTRIDATAEPPELWQGDTGQLTATGIYSDGSEQDLTATAERTLPPDGSANGIVTIGDGGTVTAIGAGTAAIPVTIAASQNGIVGTTTVTVHPRTPESIRIEPNPARVEVGQTRQLRAVSTYAEGDEEDLAAVVSWQRTDPHIATVDVDGLLTGRTRAPLPSLRCTTARPSPCR